jgi:hypothetical protein
MKTTLLAAPLLVLACIPAPAHRLDEYLQGTILSIEKNRLQAQITLTPGIAVFPMVFAGIDADGDGVISENEKRLYTARVLHDLFLTIDGQRLALHPLSFQFPAVEEMKEGRGEIQIEFQADLPRGGPNRRLIFENHHQSPFAVYQVNCLVPRDPDIRIVAQNRNYMQSYFQLDFVETGTRSAPLPSPERSQSPQWLATTAVVLLVGLAVLWRQRA